MALLVVLLLQLGPRGTVPGRPQVESGNTTLPCCTRNLDDLRVRGVGAPSEGKWPLLRVCNRPPPADTCMVACKLRVALGVEFVQACKQAARKANGC